MRVRTAGRRGGLERARVLAPARRREIAAGAANARWRRAKRATHEHAVLVEAIRALERLRERARSAGPDEHRCVNTTGSASGG